MTTQNVQKFYNQHPYPHYPLLATPRWQEGHLSSSRFARSLSGVQHSANSVCIIGCGEILPAIIRSWEPRSTTVHGVDLSKKSLIRAKFRCFRTTKKASFACEDISHQTWNHKQEKWDHIDAFGVLHHLENPQQGFHTLYRSLNPGGTLRLMVYNNASRWWIHAIQAYFHQEKLSPFSLKDINTAKKSLIQLRESCQDFNNITKNMGSIFHNNARFADTFMHPQETHLSISQWHHLLRQYPLKIKGLFDRYCELDHLTNPLHTPPSLLQIDKLAEEGFFHGNLEIYIQKEGVNTPKNTNTPFTTSSPPKNWFSHLETQDIPWRKKRQIWWDWYQNNQKTHNISFKSKQRLARIGAYHPQNEPHIHTPMCDTPRQYVRMSSKKQFYEQLAKL
ncbi:MAG: class I SAM-dependent methyltransferase [Oligoflexales bacterium]